MSQFQPIQTWPIEIDGSPYHIDLASWSGLDVIDFSPRVNVPGSGAVYADLSSYQPIAQDNWQRGYGYIWHTEEAGFLTTTGLIDTRHKNAITLFTQPVSSDANLATKRGGIAYGGNWYTWGSGGVRRYAGGSWGDVNIQTPILHAGTDWRAFDTTIATTETLTVATVDITKYGHHNVLFAAIDINDGTNVTGVTVTYDGNAMTEAPSSPTGTTPQVRLFYYVNPVPDTTNKSVIATFTLSAGSIAVVMCVVLGQYINTNDIFASGAGIDTESGTGTATTTSVTVDSMEVALCILGKVGLETDNVTVATSTDSNILIQRDDAVSRHLVVSERRQTDLSGAVPTVLTWTNSRLYTHYVIVLHAVAEQLVNYMAENGEFIFAAPKAGRILKSVDGTTWTPAGANHRSTDYNWLAIHNGYLWAGKDSASEVYFSGTSDLSGTAGLYGDPADDTTEIPVGPGKVPTLRATSFLEKLMTARPDGIWAVDPDEDTKAKTQLPFLEEKDLNNFRSMRVHRGDLFFTLLNKLYSWNGTRLQEITPDYHGDVWPFKRYGRFNNLMSYQQWLFFTARTNEANYTETIFAYDGAGIHKLVDVLADGSGEVTMMAFDPDNDYIWYHVSDSGVETTSYIPVDPNSELPWPAFPTSGTHQLETSRIHAGFRRITKSATQLIVYIDNVNETSYVRVRYRLDGSQSWVTWADVKREGVTVLDMPGGSLSIEFDFIELAFQLVTGTATKTPVVKGCALMSMLRPEVKYGYGFDIIAANEQQSGMMMDLRSAVEVKADLRDARASKSPVLLVTPLGEEVWGYLTGIRESITDYEPEGDMGGISNVTLRMHVTFVEVITPTGADSFSDIEPETAVVG